MDTCLDLWDIQDRKNKFVLKFINNNESANKDITDMHLTVDGFLKTKAKIKKAKFALVDKNLSKIFLMLREIWAD